MPFVDVIVLKLVRACYSYLSQLLLASIADLKAVTNLNEADVQMIVEVLMSIEPVPVNGAPVLNAGILSRLVYESLKAKMGFEEVDLFLAMQSDFQDYLERNTVGSDLANCLHDTKLKTLLKESSYIRSVLSEHYHEFIIENVSDVSAGDLLRITPELLQDKDYVDEIVGDLVSTGSVVEMSKGYYGFDIPAFKDEKVDFLSEQEYAILQERLKNKKYGDIAGEFGLSRREVRTKSMEALRKLIRERVLYKEDALCEIFTRFKIGYSLFTNVFGNEHTYYYLRNRYFETIKLDWKYRRPVEELLEYGLLEIHKQRLEEYLAQRNDKKGHK